MLNLKKSMGRTLAFTVLVFALSPMLSQSLVQASEREAMRLPLADKAPLVAMARAGSRIVAVGDQGIIMLSDDGATWRQATSVPVDELLTSVVFVDDLRGWAVGHAGVVLSSEDGGEHWILQSRLDGSPVLLSIWMNSSGQGLISGAYGYAVRTENGGKTWAQVKPEGDDDYHLNQIIPGANGALFIASEAGMAYRSLDGGRHWRLLDTGIDGSLWTGTALRDGRLLLGGMSGRLIFSDNQGETWQELDTGLHDAITGIIELRDGRIALVGNGGVVSVTDRRLTHFISHTNPDRQNLSALLVLDGLRVITAGQQGLQVQNIPR